MSLTTATAIDIVERGYELEGDDQGWMQRVGDALAPSLGDWGIGVYRVRANPFSGVSLEGGLVFAGPQRPWMSALSRDLIGATYEPRSTVVRHFAENAVSAITATQLASRAELKRYERMMGPFGIHDATSLHAHDGTGGLLVFVAPHAKTTTLAAGRAAMLRRVGVHLAAGIRLRQKLARACSPSAVLDASGRVLDANGALESAALRRSLSVAVRLRERARGKLRRDDPGAALSLWRGLFAGTWSLVDHWESDGRRYVVAHENAPDALDPRQLAPLERKVVLYAARGTSNADIAYALGVGTPTVSSTLSRAMRKLKVGRRAELLQLGRGARHEVELDGDTVAVLAAPIAQLDARRLNRLTPAQRPIARAIANGRSDAEIAAFLGLSTRTVTTQVSRLLARLGLESRGALTRFLVTRT